MARRNFELHAPDGSMKLLQLGGRNGWLADRLIEAGTHGLTAMDCPPGLRLAAHILRIRMAGAPILTKTETHGGEHAGWHARYSLAPGFRLARTAECCE